MRQSAAEIDHAILDVAAAMFATHGFAHTSVQQIADAVGYSKPGLLHRFGSKEAMHRAALSEVADTVRELARVAAACTGDPEQLHRVLGLLAEKAVERPGIAQMMLRAFGADAREPGVEAIRDMGQRLLDALDHPLDTPAERLRLLLGVKLIVTAATTQRSKAFADLHVEPAELVPLVVAIAVQVIEAAPHRQPVTAP